MTGRGRRLLFFLIIAADGVISVMMFAFLPGVRSDIVVPAAMAAGTVAAMLLLFTRPLGRGYADGMKWDGAGRAGHPWDWEMTGDSFGMDRPVVQGSSQLNGGFVLSEEDAFTEKGLQCDAGDIIDLSVESSTPVSWYFIPSSGMDDYISSRENGTSDFAPLERGELVTSSRKSVTIGRSGRYFMVFENNSHEGTKVEVRMKKRR